MPFHHQTAIKKGNTYSSNYYTKKERKDVVHYVDELERNSVNPGEGSSCGSKSKNKRKGQKSNMNTYKPSSKELYNQSINFRPKSRDLQNYNFQKQAGLTTNIKAKNTSKEKSESSVNKNQNHLQFQSNPRKNFQSTQKTSDGFRSDCHKKTLDQKKDFSSDANCKNSVNDNKNSSGLFTNFHNEMTNSYPNYNNHYFDNMNKNAIFISTDFNNNDNENIQIKDNENVNLH